MFTQKEQLSPANVPVLSNYDYPYSKLAEAIEAEKGECATTFTTGPLYQIASPPILIVPTLEVAYFNTMVI